MIVLIAIVALLVVGGGVTGIILATSGKKKHDTQQSSSPTNGPTNSGTDFPTGGSSGPPTGATDFPTGATDFPTDTDVPTSGGGDGTSDQVKAATNAQTVLHALGNDEPSTFCPLVDPTDLKRLLDDKHLDSCNDIELTSSTNRDDYRQFAVTDASAIKITGNIAVIPSDAVSPSGFGGVEMRKDTDGTWKYRFYTT